MQLHRLESPDGNSEWGGVLIVFDDRSAIELTWRQAAPVIDTLQGAKALAARAIDQLLRTGRGALVNSINAPSMVAALQRHLMDWNETRRAALYAAPLPGAADLQREARELGVQLGANGAAQRADYGLGGVGEDTRLH